MLIYTWLPLLVCILVSLLGILPLWFFPEKPVTPLWKLIDKLSLTLVTLCVFVIPIFIPLIITFTAPRIWIRTADGEVKERLIAGDYKGLKGWNKNYVENQSQDTLVVQKIFYGKPIGNYKNETRYAYPNEITEIDGDPKFTYPPETMWIPYSRWNTRSSLGGVYKWFVYAKP